jgi:RHS repeat-associated protein
VSLAEPDWKLATIQYSSGATKFRYDGLGRCTEISDNINGASVTKRYLWDGFKLCQEYDMTSANASNPGGIVTKRYFSQGVQINGLPYYYTSDIQGSIIHLINVNGIVESQYRYDPYGNQDEVVSSNIKSDIGYTGMFQHRPSGLALAVFRPYSPGMGRWLSRDPLGEFANFTNQRTASMPVTVNLYALASNGPINGIDPSGLSQGIWRIPTLKDLLDAWAEVGDLVNSLYGNPPEPIMPPQPETPPAQINFPEGITPPPPPPPPGVPPLPTSCDPEGAGLGAEDLGAESVEAFSGGVTSAGEISATTTLELTDEEILALQVDEILESIALFALIE